MSYGGDQTAVRRYPISIEWPLSSKAMEKPVEQCRADIRKKNGLGPDTVIGVGVDRLDYTKGILERFLAVERLLEIDPLWIGKFVFVQIAAPSRSSIDEYQDFDARVRAQARRINPSARILARCEYMSNGLKATRKGADDVVVAERVVADAFKRLVAERHPAAAADASASG